MIKINSKPTQKQLLLIGGGLLLVAVGAYIALSLMFWNSYESNYQSKQKDSLADISRFLEEPQKTGSKHTSLANLSQLSKKAATDQQDLCRVKGLFSWQLIVPAFKTKHQNCQASARSATVAAKKFDKLVNYLLYEEKLSQILAAANKATPNPIDIENIDITLRAWREASKKIDELQIDKDSSLVKNHAVDLTDQLARGYEALETASISKDEAAFVAAQEQIQAGYNNTTELHNEANRTSARLVDDFESSWSAI